jgi:glutaredoxin
MKLKEKPSDKMNTVKVQGKNNKHKVQLYTLSTCAWCKLTKQFLKDNDIAYEYTDTDLSNEEDYEKIKENVQRLGGEPLYPIIIIDEKILINGFHKDKLMEILEH